jgi:hypothetical protein
VCALESEKGGQEKGKERKREREKVCMREGKEREKRK